jgi:hypothetical protein
MNGAYDGEHELHDGYAYLLLWTTQRLFSCDQRTLGIPTTDGPEHLSTVLALEHNVEFFDFTHFDFLETPLEGPLFFYAWKASFGFFAGIMCELRSLFSPRSCNGVWKCLPSYTHARVTPVAPLLVCVCFSSLSE